MTDVFCRGAIKHDILIRSDKLLTQIDAVTAATEPVTVLVGSNDVRTISTLLGLSCQDGAAAAGS